MHMGCKSSSYLKPYNMWLIQSQFIFNLISCQEPAPIVILWCFTPAKSIFTQKIQPFFSAETTVCCAVLKHSNQFIMKTSTNIWFGMKMWMQIYIFYEPCKWIQRWVCIFVNSFDLISGKQSGSILWCNVTIGSLTKMTNISISRKYSQCHLVWHFDNFLLISSQVNIKFVQN